MDHELARINVHWLGEPAEGGQYSFHIEGLSQHLLNDATGLRAVVRAVKNILDYGSDARLRRRRKIGPMDHKRNNTVDEDHEECGQ